MQPTDQLYINRVQLRIFLGISAQKQGEAFGYNITGLNAQLSPECFTPTGSRTKGKGH